jgi:starvation-inducible outer membrane lipoprotein
MRWHGLIVLASLLGCVACGSVISPQVQSLADPALAYAQLVSNPEAYMGKVVILAGTIIEAVNTPEGTRLVLLQYSTNRRGRPQTDAPSGGRFLVLAPEYLETAIYRSGRALTVAGEVRGNGRYLSARPCIVTPFWRHAKCISGPRVVTVPHCSTLAWVLGSVRAYSRRWRLK